MNEIRVFQLNQYEWWAGPDLETVKAHYLMTTGVSAEEAFDDPCELSPESLKTIPFTYNDGKEITFAERLRELLDSGRQFPCCFAIRDC
jgi:hypothetical protein